MHMKRSLAIAILSCVTMVCGFALGERQAFAADIDPSGNHAAGFGYEILRLQGPSGDRADRFLYALKYQWALSEGGRVDVTGTIGPDTDKRSRYVDVRENIFGLYPMFTATHVALFRFGAGIGPYLFRTTTVTKVGDQKSETTFQDSGVAGRLSIEYAFNPYLELNATLGLQRRSRSERDDWSYGLNLVGYFM